jgi:hypothetical protein
MYAVKYIKANRDNLITHFLQIRDRYLVNGELWGMDFNKDLYESKFARDLTPENYSRIKIEDLFSVVSMRSTMGMRAYLVPQAFAVIEDDRTNKIRYSPFDRNHPKLYHGHGGSMVTYCTEDAHLAENDHDFYQDDIYEEVCEDYVGLEYLNEIYLINLYNGKNVVFTNEYGDEWEQFSPIFWERGDISFCFYDEDKLRVSEEDRVNGYSLSFYKMINETKALELE